MSNDDAAAPPLRGTDPREDDDGMVEDVGDEIIVDAPLDEDTGDPAETGANRDPGADLDSQGVPAYAESDTPGDPDDPGPVPEPIVPAVPNLDAPSVSFDWGTTADEQREGEPLDLRLAREEPDVGPGAYDDDATFDADDSPHGVLVQPDEGAHSDTDAEEIGVLDERAMSDLSAEEAAIHIEPER